MTYFEWDTRKERANIRKHNGISFHVASSVFFDPLAMTFFDPDHSEHEDRLITLGMASTGTVLFVSHTEVGEKIRIISAREATRQERRSYEES